MEQSWSAHSEISILPKDTYTIFQIKIVDREFLHVTQERQNSREKQAFRGAAKVHYNNITATIIVDFYTY